MRKKIFWNFMLALSILLFILTIFSNNIGILFLSLALALLVRIKGDKVIFKEYNQKRLERIKLLRALSVKK